jgi:hypothetical protein
MARKLPVKTSTQPAFTVARAALKSSKLVYIATANKPLRYPDGRSAIAYVGTTKVGAGRIATSAAFRAQNLLTLHGVKELRFYVVTCKGRQRLQTWKQQENDLLLAFKGQYGRLPLANKRGGRRGGNAFKWFNRSRLEKVLDSYKEPR